MTSFPVGLVDNYAAGLLPRTVQSFPDWADENIVLRKGGRRVKWQTSLTPYLREIMLRLSADDSTEEIVIMKPSQWGASEMLNCFFAYVMDCRPTPGLLFQPDIDAARRYVIARLNPVLEDCRALDGVLVQAKSREPGNTNHTKTFADGITLDILGGNSPAGTASKPAGVIAIDEWDRMGDAVGVGTRAEGDLYELAKNRSITFTRWRKIVAASTPGNTSTSKVEPAYLASDRRQWWVPCPLCGKNILLDFEQLWWPGENVKQVVYRCQCCDNAFGENHKGEMNAHGLWIPEVPGRSVLGYWSNGLYSPWLKWHEIAERWQKAKGKPGKVRVFFNNILAKSYDLHHETRVAPHQLAVLRVDLRLEYGVPVVPGKVAVLTAGADVQGDRIEVVIFGWGAGEECWHIDHAIIRGDPTGDQVWADLDAYLKRDWLTEAGELKRVRSACIDTGYQAQRVHDFVLPRSSRGFYGVKGSSGGVGRRIWPRAPSRATYRRAELYIVGQDTAKTHIYARLKASIAASVTATATGAGMVHIAAHIGTETYLEQLVSESPVTVTVHGHPRVVWDLPEHRRNEALDCAVYGYAALQAWKARGLRLPRMPAAQPLSPPTPPEKSISTHLTSRVEIGPPALATPLPTANKAVHRKVPRQLW